MTTENESEDLDARIEELSSRLGDFLEKAMSRSASHLAAEIKRLAKAEQLLEPYTRATFHLADIARDLLEPDVCRAQAVELIALLESEDHARLIQADFPQAEYESALGRYSTCAYDNLADGTAMAQGYNSEGMHGCITDGLQVCQRSGRLECVNCFREYAADVYLAADDLPLALHQARLIAAPENTRTPRGDRRWLGTRYQAWVLLLTGQLGAAEEAARKAVELTDSPQMNLPMYAKLRAIPMLETMRLLSGQEVSGVEVAGRPAPGEYPLSDLYEALVLALAAACRGDHASAVATLSRWDRLLQGQNCLHEWFEVRLRLTAAYLLADNRKQAESLAAQLRTKAKAARDWLTLRRLEHLVDPRTRPVPVPTLMPLDAGPFAGVSPAVSVAVPVAPVESEAVPEVPPPSPLQAVLAPLIERVEAAAQDAEDRPRLLDEVLAHRAEDVTDAGDAAKLLYLGGRLADVPGRGRDLWAWGEPFAAKFPLDAKVLNLLAWLGYCLGSTSEAVNPGQDLEQTIPPDVIDKLFRQSLDLDANYWKHFARAGLYYLAVGDLGEAERCLARACRLDRSNGFLAMRLADVYRQTDRPRDGLMVLDTCLREGGGGDPDVAWQAGMTALDLEQWESLVTYLNRYEEGRPGEETAAYYTAFGLLASGRHDEALALLTGRIPPPGSGHVEVLRACVEAACGRGDEFRAFLGEHLDAVRLSQWDNVPRREMIRLYARLWDAADCVRGEPIHERLADFLLGTGLAPDDLFEEVRDRGEKREDGKYYRCVVLQPLAEDWPASRVRLPNEEDWTAYRAAWGVLAADEEEAARVVLGWQSRCYFLDAEVEDIQLDSENYTDKFGVVWQGMREGVEEDDE